LAEGGVFALTMRGGSFLAYNTGDKRKKMTINANEIQISRIGFPYLLFMTYSPIQ